VKNVNKINILKIFVKNLIGNGRFVRLTVLLVISILLTQTLGTVIAEDKEVPDPTGLP